MRVGEIYGTTLEKILNREHNIYIGISMGNRYFSKENIEAYIEWGLRCTRENLIVFIADSIQSYNYQAFRGLTEKEATVKAADISIQYKNMVKRIINRMKNMGKLQKEIPIIGFDTAADNDYYRQNREKIQQEYHNNPRFRDAIIDLMKQNVKAITQETTREQLDIAANYLLLEIPLQYHMTHEGTTYDLIPYPGVSTAKFLDRLQNKEIFPELAEKLGLGIQRLAQIELYVK